MSDLSYTGQAHYLGDDGDTHAVTDLVTCSDDKGNFVLCLLYYTNSKRFPGTNLSFGNPHYVLLEKAIKEGRLLTDKEAAERHRAIMEEIEVAVREKTGL